MVVNSNEPLQLGLLPNFDVPMGLLKQRPTKATRSLQKLDFKGTEEQLQVECAAKAIAEDKQSPHCSTTVQPLNDWERSHEFTVSVEGQDVRVNFRAFYFSGFGSCRGYHHFEFHGHSTSPTGYRSDFLQASVAISWSSPIAYAQDKAQELHAELLKQQRKQQRATRRKVKNG